MSTRERVLEFIKEYKERYENSPTYREIMEGVGLASTSTVSRHLKALEEEGLIERDEFRPRSIRIVKEEA
jgi:repressor LexA